MMEVEAEPALEVSAGELQEWHVSMMEVEAEPALEVSAGELQEWHVLVFGFRNVIWTIPKHPLQRVNVMESTACTHQQWCLGHDIVGHQEGGSAMRSLPLISSSRKAR
jgi:hypothetical protein